LTDLGAATIENLAATFEVVYKTNDQKGSESDVITAGKKLDAIRPGVLEKNSSEVGDQKLVSAGVVEVPPGLHRRPPLAMEVAPRCSR